jgi:putative ABC transport system substrate-binding protein
MRLIGLAVVLSVSLVLATLAAEAQQSGKTYRIGWLAYGWTEGAEGTSPEFVDELKKYQLSFVFEFRGHQDEKRLTGQARELVQAGVDVIVANGTVAAQAARSVTQSVPIVFLISGDPIGSGLVTSLARPGGNVTGPSAMSADFATKRLELFKQAIPSLNRIGVLGTYDTASGSASWKEIEAAAPQARLELRRITARGAADFEGAFAMVSKEKIDGLVVMNDPRLVAARNRLAELALRTRVPTMFEEWRSKSGDSLRPEA